MLYQSYMICVGPSETDELTSRVTESFARYSQIPRRITAQRFFNLWSLAPKLIRASVEVRRRCTCDVIRGDK